MNTTQQPFNSDNARNEGNINDAAASQMSAVGEEFFDADEVNQTNEEIADRGYTIRNGYNPNEPNPDQERITNDEDDLDDLDDDFHSPKDLEHDDENIEVNDEFDNPSDESSDTDDDEDMENVDFDEEEEDFEEIEIDDQPDGNYQENEPRKF